MSSSLAANTPNPTLPLSSSIDGASTSSSSSSSSVSSGASDYDEEEEARIAAEEWERLVGQTKMLLGLAIPFLAGFAGRKFGLKGEFELDALFPSFFSVSPSLRPFCKNGCARRSVRGELTMDLLCCWVWVG